MWQALRYFAHKKYIFGLAFFCVSFVEIEQKKSSFLPRQTRNNIIKKTMVCLAGGQLQFNAVKSKVIAWLALAWLVIYLARSLHYKRVTQLQHWSSLQYLRKTSLLFAINHRKVTFESHSCNALTTVTESQEYLTFW